MLGRLLVMALHVVGMSPASAGWGVHGESEPNTPEDLGGLMFLDADVRPDGRRVYFNGLLVHAYTGVNPNLAVLGGNLLLPGQHFAFAYFGFWKDCNRDGYIGLAEGALLEYRAEILTDTTSCPPDASASPWNGMYVHHDGEWVRELLWIGWGDNAANPQGRATGVFHDPDARVWADDGLPGAEGIVGCPVNPPSGTFSSTGGILAWLDCYGNRGVIAAANPVLAEGNARGVDLDFENPEFPQCSESALNVPLHLLHRDPRCPAERAGLLEPRGGSPAFVVWDCERRYTVRDWEGRELVALPLPRDLPHVDPEGSLYDGASHVVGGVEGQCSDTGGSSLDDVYVGLQPEQPVLASTIRRETTFAFEFFHDRAGSYLGRVVEDPRMPPALGVAALQHAGVAPVVGGARLGPGWQSEVSRFASPPLVRRDLAPESATHYTFYAYVGPVTRQIGAELPMPVAQIYGAAWCGENDSGIFHGVDCDPTHWWNETHGASAMPVATWTRAPIGVRIGQSYQLRDVDCHDGRPVRSVGVFVGLTTLSEETPCLPPTGNS